MPATVLPSERLTVKVEPVIVAAFMAVANVAVTVVVTGTLI